MININCSSDCRYQKDGKCILDKVEIQKFSGNSDCIYYQTKSNCKK